MILQFIVEVDFFYIYQQVYFYLFVSLPQCCLVSCFLATKAFLAIIITQVSSFSCNLPFIYKLAFHSTLGDHSLLDDLIVFFQQQYIFLKRVLLPEYCYLPQSFTLPQASFVISTFGLLCIFIIFLQVCDQVNIFLHFIYERYFLISKGNKKFKMLINDSFLNIMSFLQCLQKKLVQSQLFQPAFIVSVSLNLSLFFISSNDVQTVFLPLLSTMYSLYVSNTLGSFYRTLFFRLFDITFDCCCYFLNYLVLQRLPKNLECFCRFLQTRLLCFFAIFILFFLHFRLFFYSLKSTGGFFIFIFLLRFTFLFIFYLASLFIFFDLLSTYLIVSWLQIFQVVFSDEATYELFFLLDFFLGFSFSFFPLFSL